MQLKYIIIFNILLSIFRFLLIMDSFFENLNIHPKFGCKTRQAIPGQIIKKLFKSNNIQNDDWSRMQISFMKSLMQQMNISDPDKKAQFENIVSIHQIQETENYLYIFMEECEEQLYQNINQKDSRIRADPEKIFDIAQQIIKGYKFLKSTKVDFHHGNIDLEHLFIKKVNERTVIKISGFVIQKPEDVIMSSRLFGKQMYIAPELLNDLNLMPSTQSDIYSIGICLYLMLNGLRSQIAYKGNRLQLDISTNYQLCQLIMDMTHLQQNERISWADLEERVLFQHKLLYSNSQTFSDDKSGFIGKAQLIMNYYKVLEDNQIQYNDFIQKNKSYKKYFKRVECIIKMLEQSDCQETYMLVQLIIFISKQDLSIFFSEIRQINYKNLEFLQIKQYFIKISAQTSLFLSKQDYIKNINDSQSSGQRQQQILQNLQKKCQNPKYFQKFIQSYHCDPEDKYCCLIQ
ncbi:hypothetical protein pb186bvf_008303 [Paramecium bursaria]